MTTEQLRAFFQSIAEVAIAGQDAIDAGQLGNAAACLDSIEEDAATLRKALDEDYQREIDAYAHGQPSRHVDARTLAEQAPLAFNAEG